MGMSIITIAQALDAIEQHEISPLELVRECLDRIHQFDAKLNSFITVLDEQSLARSESLGMHPPGRLHGIPIALKDLFETANIRTTAGSRFFRDYIPENDAQVVERLKSAGAVILGKNNMHEIALGVTNINPHYGTCRNPWDEKRIAGGSSGGSAVAVATGMCLGALGTDTGGSIRIPASLCGIVGFKPTRGRVSLQGVLPLSWNLDHVGPMARTVRDVSILLQVIAGHDPQDPYSMDVPVPDYIHGVEGGVKDWHVAVLAGSYMEDSDSEVLGAIKRASKILKKLGATIHELDLPILHQAALANGQIVQADAAAFHCERLAGAAQNFGDDVRRRLEAGAGLSSTDYILARRTQAKISHWFSDFFTEYRVLVLPTTPIPAPLIEGTDSVEQARRLTRFTAPFNLTGLPALSLPAGFTGHGLPIGLQVVSGAWMDASVLRAGFAIEQEIGEHTHNHPDPHKYQDF
jgi:aspartyl-tRNA(Asn)/glutamyl-tRNA(Gln) amidotransferase subunit A